MNKKHEEEFMEFCQERTTNVPEHLSSALFDHVRRDLNPNKSIVAGKLVTIQSFVGILTMLFCPQFELSLTANHELYHFFHRNFGQYGCMAVCGAIFMGSGAIMAGLTLRFSELDMILSSRYLISFSLSGLAILSFLVFGAEIYIGLASAWILGGAIAVILAIDGGKVLRTMVLQYNDRV